MQGKQLRKLEAELWRAADQLRANSKLTASEYSMPVLGLIFLRHAYNRFRKVKIEVEKDLPVHPQRGKRPIKKQDFEERNAMFLPEQAQFDYLVALPESANIGAAIDDAMRLIEEEHENLKGVLPKNFSIFSEELLRELLRIFNKEVLQRAEGDLFGKIYEYFLNKFAMTGAQEGGEFFTPMSLVQTIVNVIEPDHGIVFDPACGSAGMFVQTGYFMESEGLKPAEKVIFYGQEKAEMNTKLAKMNLAVHGLEGKIQEGNTFYEDKHDLVGKADFVMANPPFNVDGVDKGKENVKRDPRLMLDGKVNLPKNDNANYLWIQYFYNYLKPTGRAGFVMASSASDAGHSEKEIREKLVKTGAVDVMIAIGNNFFYTRSLPCTLWFFDRTKEQDAQRKNEVLMLDARKIYRKVTTTINDFTPEQLQNIVCIVNLYRGNKQKFADTVQHYVATAQTAANDALPHLELIKSGLEGIFVKLNAFANPTANVLPLGDAQNPAFAFVLPPDADTAALHHAIDAFGQAVENKTEMAAVAAQAAELRRLIDKYLKQLNDAIVAATKTYQLNKNNAWKLLNIKDLLEQLRQAQLLLNGNADEEESGLLQDVDYFYQQALWLTNRFPDGNYADVEGLCKKVNQQEIEAKDWSLSPGRYVGVDATNDADFDYKSRLKAIHAELEKLNAEAETLAAVISENFKNIGV